MRARGRTDRPAVILLHGYGESLESWDQVAVELSADLRTLALDLRGHGQSGWADDGDYSLAATVGDLERTAEHLGLSRFAIAGHSTGGMTAVAFAAAHPEAVTGLALLETDPFIFKDGLERLTAFHGPEELPSFAAFVAAYAARRGASADEAAVAARLRPLLRAGRGGAWTWRQDPRLRPREYTAPTRPRSEAEVIRMVESVRSPLLLLRGEKSPVLDQDSVARTLRRFTGCGTSGEEIPGAGHALLADNAEAVTRALARFFFAGAPVPPSS